MESYHYQPTDEFKVKLEKIGHRDPEGHNRILQVIDRLLVTPEYSDGTMHGVYQGRLKKYVGRTEYRLIYNWCKECRKARKLRDHCGHCKQVSDNSVIFFDVYHKNEQCSHLRHVG
jgi:hypothetical protein